MAGEQRFEERGDGAGGALPRPSWPDPGRDLDAVGPEDWRHLEADSGEMSPEELGLVDPMSPEDFAAICSGKVRWIEAPRFDPDLFDPLPGAKDVCRCACGHPHEPPPAGHASPADRSSPAVHASPADRSSPADHASPADHGPSAADRQAPPEADGSTGAGSSAAAEDAGAGGAETEDASDPFAWVPSPEAAMAQIRLERAAEVLDALEANEAEQARLDADRALLLAALVRAEGSSSEVPVDRLDAPAVAAAEAAAVLKLPQRTARAMVEEALALTHPDMAPVLAAMRAGRLTRRRAAVILDAATPIPRAKLAEFATAAAAIAAPEDPDRTPTPGALARRLHRLAEDYTDEPLAQRKAKALADRHVDLTPCGDGMAHLTALLPLETGALIDTRLTALARSLQTPDETRTVNQLRTDALTDLLTGKATPTGTHTGAGTCVVVGTGTGTGSPMAPAGGVRTELVVTVPAATLAGTSDTPGEILGYGPIDPEAARRLAAQTQTWTRLVVHPLTGAPLAIGRTRYAPTAAMRRFLALRDATCSFPGCDKPHAATEADHTRPWAHGGNTDTNNLALLCPEHHRLKTLGYWKARHIGHTQTTEQQPEQKTGPEPAPDTSSSPGTAPPPEPPDSSPPPKTPNSPPPPGTLEWTGPSGRKHRTYPHTDPPPPF